ncbi:methyltransferase [Catellatospora sp. TT07R-123]|uniref:methyltransferase domain-containing protein n=1 Tax=Catellatospora sp. TT07R-123 TaxID=2733863 RepID=UPI001B0CC20A|nr:methyltransferase domain-containing protein [Catellatospora sp. TT07R-123]GHJ44974.1 methyltransferase [Catellatospora sp. TT07R-123]
MERTSVAQPRIAGPRTAVIWSVLRAELAAQDGRRLTVVDVGGGTGGFAVPLAEAGHSVTVVDPSPDALASLLRRAADAGVADRVHAMQGDADSLGDLVPPGGADLVLCHAVLEVVDDPAEVVQALHDTLRPGGAASVLVANRAAAVLSRAMAGQWRAAADLLADPDARLTARDTLRRRFDLDGAQRLLAGAGLGVESVHGVRVVADAVPGVVADADPEALTAFELAVSALPPYRDVATQVHLLARRRAAH